MTRKPIIAGIGITVFITASLIIFFPLAPADSFREKAEKMQRLLPAWLLAHPDEQAQIEPLLKQFGRYIDKKQFPEAENILNDIFAVMEAEPSGNPAQSVYNGKKTSLPKSVKPVKLPPGAELIFHKDGYLFSMDQNGANVTRLTFDAARNYEHAAVSNNRRYIVANEHPRSEPGRSTLLLYDIEKNTETQLIPDFYLAGDGGVDWAPDGYIYFKGKAASSIRCADVYKIKNDGTGLLQLTNTPDVEESDISVSDDGTLVTYVLLVPEPEKNSAHTEIWIINSDGSGPRRIYTSGTVQKASAHDPEISPDNKKVIFSRVNSEVPSNYPGIPAANTAHDIWVINIDGSGLTRLTKPGPISMIPDWKDNMIVYTEISEKDKYAGASIVNAEGEDQSPRRIKSGANSPKWIPK